jgi:hypothetical protein
MTFGARALHLHRPDCRRSASAVMCSIFIPVQKMFLGQNLSVTKVQLVQEQNQSKTFIHERSRELSFRKRGGPTYEFYDKYCST